MFEKYENEIKLFCRKFGVIDINELKPIQNNSSNESFKFLAINVYIALKNLGLIKNFHKFILTQPNTKTPFFDKVDYKGVKLQNKSGNTFYFIFNEGRVGLEDHFPVYCTIGPSLNNSVRYPLIYNTQYFGDVNMKAEDENRNIATIVNALTEKFQE